MNASGIGVLEAVVGIWLFISPTVLLVHSNTGRELLNFMVVGGILVVTGILASVHSSAASKLARTRAHRRWSWVWFIAAAWLLVSPWVVGYSDSTRLVVNAVVCAAIVAALALANWSLTNRMGPEEHRGVVPASGRLDVEP